MTGWLVAEVNVCPRSSSGLHYSPKSVSKNRMGGKKRCKKGRGRGKGKRRNGGKTRVARRKRSPGTERRLGGLKPGVGGWRGAERGG